MVGWVITKYSGGGGRYIRHVCICDILDIHKTHTCTVMIEVHADMCMECRGINGT